MITLMKKAVGILAMTVVLIAMPLTAEALEAKISGAGNGNFLLTGNIGKNKNNKNVAVTVYKPEKTAGDITTENPLSSLYHIGQATADNSGNFEYLIAAEGELDSFSKYRVVVSESTGEEISFFAVAEPLNAAVNMTEFGHNYFDAERVSYNIRIEDLSNMTKEAQAQVKIYDVTENELVFQKAYEGIALDDIGTAAFSDTLDFETLDRKYGVFRMELTVTADGKKPNTVTTVFANIRKAADKNQKVGIQHHYGNIFTGTGQADVVKLFADAGYGLARDGINWTFYEKEDDKFVMYDEVSEYIEEAEANGVKMLMTSSRGNSKIVPENIIASETALNEYGEYIYNMVYDTVGMVSTYEIMNEVNHYQYNPETKMTPEQYFNIVKTASTNAKAAAEQKSKDKGKVYKAEICGGGLAYVTYEDADLSYWVDELFKLGIGEYIDKFSYHLYTQGSRPEKSVKQTVADEVRSIIDGYGYTDMPIVLSEIGYSSTSDYENSEYRQAIYELRDLALLYDKFDEIYFYCGMNKQNEDSEYERELGHIRTWYDDIYNSSGVAYSAKPVFAAMANFNALLANAELTKKSSGSDFYNYEFENSDGKTVNMLWNSGDTDAEYILNTDASSILLYDMYGNRTEMESEDGTYTIGIGAAPVYAVDNTKPLTLEKENGEDIDTLENKVYLKADKTYLSEFGNSKVIIAQYQGKTLMNCAYMDFSELAQSGRMEISVPNADRLSVFMWNDLSILKPVNTKIELLKEEK
ncbi:MAG: hypothetical protein ACI4DY_10645 [Monoglobaceae bacterium]